MQTRKLIYDGTFDGLLTAVFTVYDEKIESVIIQNTKNIQKSLFTDNEFVVSDLQKSNRVWNGVKKYNSSVGCHKLYTAFLSEQYGVETTILNYIQYLFSKRSTIDQDIGNPFVLKISKIAKSVNREKHRMEAFVRFKMTTDGIYFANISPDFNVLPLIKKHFTNRYADQKWIIYDTTRNYGLFYDLKNTEIIYLEFPNHFNFSSTSENFFTEEEIQFQELWKDYFKSTNIKSRKNTKLHLQHVPKRYWKYLSEKQ